MSKENEQLIKIINKDQLSELATPIKDWVTEQKKQTGSHKLQIGDQEYTLISLGMRPNPGYQLEVVEVHTASEEIKVTLEETTPKSGYFYPQMVVYPYILTESKVPIQVEVKVADEPNKES